MNDIIMNFIEEGNFLQAKKEIIKMNVVDVAYYLEEQDREKLLVIFRLLPKEVAVDVFSYISNEQKQHIIESITDQEITSIIEKLFLDDTVDLLEELPSNVVKRVLKNTSPNRRKLINQFLNYPRYSAGSIMTIEYVDLKREMTIKESLYHIKETGINKETINICYVIDEKRKLEGIISLSELVLNEEATIIKEIMNTHIISVSTYTDQEKVASLFKKYDLITMPVVDRENRLVGIITVDDIIDVIEEEDTEDFQRMAAIEPSQEEYLKASVFSLAKNRISWLLILMISATFTGNIISKFEEILDSVIILASFIPMLMDTGGNAGSQSATLIIRGLALGEIEIRDSFKILWKELRVALIVGIVLSLTNFIRVYYLQKVDYLISLTVCISLFLTVVLANIVGGVLPVIAQKLKLDPAMMASPLITTIVDVVALTAYFSIASWLLGI